MSLKTVEWKDNSVIMIDQTKLPNILEYVTYTDYNEIADAIRTLVVRGAPAIGVSGAFGLALAALQSTATKKDELIGHFRKVGGSYSSTFSFEEHFSEEISIRLNNKQNKFIICLIIFNNYIRKIFKRRFYIWKFAF